jgi:hypothetical protein
MIAPHAHERIVTANSFVTFAADPHSRGATGMGT